MQSPVSAVCHTIAFPAPYPLHLPGSFPKEELVGKVTSNSLLKAARASSHSHVRTHPLVLRVCHGLSSLVLTLPLFSLQRGKAPTHNIDSQVFFYSYYRPYISDTVQQNRLMVFPLLWSVERGDKGH